MAGRGVSTGKEGRKLTSKKKAAHQKRKSGSRKRKKKAKGKGMGNSSSLGKCLACGMTTFPGGWKGKGGEKKITKEEKTPRRPSILQLGQEKKKNFGIIEKRST